MTGINDPFLFSVNNRRQQITPAAIDSQVRFDEDSGDQ